MLAMQSSTWLQLIAGSAAQNLRCTMASCASCSCPCWGASVFAGERGVQPAAGSGECVHCRRAARSLTDFQPRGKTDARAHACV
eukprot:scaffold4959_cov14-Tisochrysis_lutea.AAC.2